MPNIYVRSTDGSDVDDGSTWALAKATLAGAGAIDVAGDTIYISNNHSESTAGSVTISLAGTIASPSRVICADDAAEPPTAVATTAIVATTGATNLGVNGVGYIYGVTFSAASGFVANNFFGARLPGNFIIFEQCVIDNRTNASSTQGPTFGADTSGLGSEVILINSNIRMNNTTHRIGLVNGIFRWRGGTLLGSAITSLFAVGSVGRGGLIEVENVDLSAASPSLSLVGFGATARATFRNCKLPAGWSGSLGGTAPGCIVEMYNCDSGDTNYSFWIQDTAGSVRPETVFTRTNGASDGSTPISWKMVTVAAANYPATKLSSPEIVQWNETTGTSLTASIEIVHDSQGAGAGARFQNDEIWLEVMYLGTSGNPLGTWITDCKADVLAVAANQDDSSWTWSTPGMTTPVRQKLAVTFTPQEKGFIHARVVVAKASKTVYVCPKITVL